MDYRIRLVVGVGWDVAGLTEDGPLWGQRQDSWSYRVAITHGNSVDLAAKLGRTCKLSELTRTVGFTTDHKTLLSSFQFVLVTFYEH